MAASNATVTALKSAFIHAQVNQVLSKPVDPSARALRGPAEGEPLPDRVIRDVTQKVNRRLQEHSRNVWSSITIRKIAEQIDWLYWNSAEPESDDDDSYDPHANPALLQTDDLSTDENIAKLPGFLADLSSTLPSTERKSLSAKAVKLESLGAQRQALLKKMRMYDELLSLLAPFSQPQASIQPNIVTRDGPLSSELAKLRTLSIRLAGRLSDQPDSGDAGQDTDMHETENGGGGLWVSGDEKLSKLFASDSHP